MLMKMALWMTKSAFLLCTADIAGVFQILYQDKEDYHKHVVILKLSTIFVLAALSSSMISKWLGEERIWAARIWGHLGLLIALVTAALLLSLPFKGRLRWFPLVACVVHLSLLLLELHKEFCSTETPPEATAPSSNIGEAPSSVATSRETGHVTLHSETPISESSNVELSLNVETNPVEPPPDKFNWFSRIFRSFHWISLLCLLKILFLRQFPAVVGDSCDNVSSCSNQESPATDIEVAGSPS